MKEEYSVHYRMNADKHKPLQMKNNLILVVLGILTIVNLVVLFQIKSISSKSSAPVKSAAAMTAECDGDLISECYDAIRFPGTTHRGAAWRIDRDRRTKYSDNFYSKYAVPARSVFISKPVLNQIFNDPEATGVICTFAIDDKGSIGLVVEPGLSDSINLAAPTASAADRINRAILGLVGINEAVAGDILTSNQIFYSKIYCPPKCPTDSVRTDTTARHRHKDVQ